MRRRGRRAFPFDHSNVVLPPSVHVQGSVYRWKTSAKSRWSPGSGSGHLRLRRAGKRAQGTRPGRRKPHGISDSKATSAPSISWDARNPWLPAELINADEDKYSHSLPLARRAQHPGQSRFLHRHLAATRTLAAIQMPSRPLFWTQVSSISSNGRRAKEPGIVDRFCTRSRVYEPGQLDDDSRPRVLHPNDRLDSEVHTELGTVIGPKHAWFKRADRIVTIDRRVPPDSSTQATRTPNTRLKLTRPAFANSTPRKPRASLEEYVVPGNPGEGRAGQQGVRQEELLHRFLRRADHSVHLHRKLPDITPGSHRSNSRFRVKDKLVFPRPGYDAALRNVPGRPCARHQRDAARESLEGSRNIHREFCFTRRGRAQRRTPSRGCSLLSHEASSDGRPAFPCGSISPIGRAAEKIISPQFPCWSTKAALTRTFQSERIPRKPANASWPPLEMAGISCTSPTARVYLQDQYLAQVITNPSHQRTQPWLQRRRQRPAPSQ